MKIKPAIDVMQLDHKEEGVVARIHNAAFSGWIQALEPCFSYRDINSHTVNRWKKEPGAVNWLAYFDRDPVGYAHCHLRHFQGEIEFAVLQFALTHPNWGQSAIGILPEYQQRGVGTLLLERILEAYQAQGVEIAMAWVYNFNPAGIALFEKLGFENQERTFYEPYSRNEPLSYDSVYAKLDLTGHLLPENINEKLIVRKPLPKDENALTEVFHFSAPYVFGGNPTRDNIKRWLGNPKSECILVGEYQGVVVGAMEYFKNSLIGIPGVLPVYRGKGFGTTLFFRLLENMRRAGHEYAIGDTGVIQEGMMSLYEKFGFDLSRRLLNWVIKL
jgi:GNAT superfamily N-acetyltransferase